MKKRLAIFGLLLLGGIFISYQFRILPLVSTGKIKNSNIMDTLALNKGDTIKVLNQYDFDSGDYSIYVVFSNQEGKRLGFSKVLFTDDIAVLNQINQSFEMTYTGGDIATCESFIYLLQGDDVIFKAGLAIDDVAGLQSSQYGWLEFRDKHKALDCLKAMTKSYKPFIKL